MKIEPMLNDAFAAGAAGKDPVLNAARVEAALLWFLFVSPYKETRTCATAQADCDSGWAYYTGGDDDRTLEGRGFARYVRARSKQAHDAIGTACSPCGAGVTSTTPPASPRISCCATARWTSWTARCSAGSPWWCGSGWIPLACGGTWSPRGLRRGARPRGDEARRDEGGRAARRARPKLDATTVDVKAAKAALDGLLWGCPY